MIEDNISEEETKHLEKLLGEFDYKRQATLPAKLLEAVNKGNCIACIKKGEDKYIGQLVLSLQEIFYIHGTLRAHLCNNRGYKHSDKIPALYIGGLEKRSDYLYYSPDTGERLGDVFGINKWVLED